MISSKLDLRNCLNCHQWQILRNKADLGVVNLWEGEVGKSRSSVTQFRAVRSLLVPLDFISTGQFQDWDTRIPNLPWLITIF